MEYTREKYLFISRKRNAYWMRYHLRRGQWRLAWFYAKGIVRPLKWEEGA